MKEHDLKPITPRLEFLAQAKIDVHPPQIIGHTALGERRIVPIAGGKFEGRLHGEVIPGGADWQIVTASGATLLEARYTLRTTDGALIYIRNKGVRHGPPEVMSRLARGERVDPAEYYCRTTPSFETGDPRYAWLNGTIAVGSAARTIQTVLVEFYEVL
jgi:hypothetical protein